MPALMAQVGASQVTGKPLAPVVPLHQPRPILAAGATRCPKCDSGFVTREPAFLHCRFCGTMARIVGGSLVDQELYERRSGFRLAS